MGVSCSIRFESYAVATNIGSQLNSVSRQKEMVDIRIIVMDSWANMKEPAARSSKCSSSALRAPGKGVGGSGCSSGQHVEAKRASYEREARRASREGRVVEDHPHPLHAGEVIILVISHRLCSSELLQPRPISRRFVDSAP